MNETTPEQDALAAIKRYHSSVEAANVQLAHAQTAALGELKSNSVVASILAGGLSVDKAEEVLRQRSNG